MSIDGSKGVMVMTITLLNCKDFSVQSRDSCIVLSMYNGAEGRDEFNYHFKRAFEGMSKLIEEGIRHNDKHYTCEVFLVNDWKSFMYCCNMFDDGRFCG